MARRGGVIHRAVWARAKAALLSIAVLVCAADSALCAQPSLQKWLDAKRVALGLPAMGAVVLSLDRIRALAVSGVRRLGGNDRVRRGDA
ncbi:hypothetical protein [Varunaivibrio sulfuroxidans]|uniref:hypothetical protein n=1 Tax=Varunaivibrio sulfuroxidans TaxID=1773489 RepID=UPI00105183A5|nr:hypothetical protein [Varunaivibrio sulfuroxidans]WES30026.1 hypothetical protein P3M64_10310 [Varunaivibrio sulfuroxidans]